jgi:hypothetical protein
MLDILDRLDCKYHELWLVRSCYILVKDKDSCLNDNHLTDVGFWGTYDLDRCLIRCGVTTDLQRTIKQFDPWENEIIFSLKSAWFDNYKPICEYKQEFKRCWREIKGDKAWKEIMKKHIPETLIEKYHKKPGLVDKYKLKLEYDKDKDMYLMSIE